jgi:hypothetical protein
MEKEEEVKMVGWRGSPVEELYGSDRNPAAGGRSWQPAQASMGGDVPGFLRCGKRHEAVCSRGARQLALHVL